MCLVVATDHGWGLALPGKDDPKEEIGGTECPMGWTPTG